MAPEPASRDLLASSKRLAGADAAQATGLCGATKTAARAEMSFNGLRRWPGQKHTYAALDLGTIIAVS